MEDDPAEEEDDFEVDVEEAVDVVSFALPSVATGFDELEFESIAKRRR